MHCELTYSHIDDHWLICDLQSKNGIKVNGSWVIGAQVLRPGDKIAIGKRIFIFE
jgi:pSer/pThr/pTyr-binding forkhead associated (FHA) protein